MEFAAISPSDGLLMAPGVAAPRRLARLGMTLDDFALVEMLERSQIRSLATWRRGGTVGSWTLSARSIETG